MLKNTSTFARLLAALLALLLTAGITVTVVDDDGPAPARTTVTVKLGGPAVAAAPASPDANAKVDDAVVLDKPAQEQVEDLADDKPVPVPGQGTPLEPELADPLRESNDTKAGILEGPLAAQEFPGCRTRFVGNYSSRNGVSPKVIVWHQTVSRERGTSSQNALTAYANRRSSGASWHFLIGRTNGLCTFSVPLNLKAWTQGNANPFSFGIEIEAFGDEPSYVTGAGKRKLLAVTRELGRRFDIPMRRAVVRDCRVIKSGILEHSDVGACGGGHQDVTSTRRPEPAGWNVDRLIRELAAATAPRRVTSTDRRTCAKLNAWRRADRPRGGGWERNSVRRRRALDARRVTCTTKGPVRR